MTGNFEVADVVEMTAAVNDIDRLQGNRELNMSWWEMGPDNIGGRTRAILALSDNVIFAGSVTGGLYKSTNGGNNWTRVESLDTFGRVMSISSINDSAPVGRAQPKAIFGRGVNPTDIATAIPALRIVRSHMCATSR